MNDLIITDMFKFPVLAIDTTLDTQPLIDYAYELKSKTKGRELSNVQAWQSENLDNNLPVFDVLNDVIIKFAKDFHEYMNLKKDYTQILDNMWFNINPTGGTNKPHSHPGAVFSGVFYLKAPENSGKINFVNPCRAHDYHFNQDTVEKYNNYTWSGYYHLPKSGKLVMFPASIEHYVDGNTTGEDRISIAFNTKFLV